MESIVPVPSSWEDAKHGLLPQLWPLSTILERQAGLGWSLPWCGLHGEEDDEARKAYDIGVVVVYDPAKDGADHGGLERLVLSQDLQNWRDETWITVLRQAVENLRTRTACLERAPGFERFLRHETGCAASKWSDRYDAARCALLPSLVAKLPGAGSRVCIFATQKCALAATARNPLSLCYAGDCAATKLSDQPPLSKTPYRLVKVKVGTKVARHPLVQKAGEGVRWRWQRYLPAVASGEFCVPSTEEEVTAILESIEKGEPMPVFGAISDARHAAVRVDKCQLHKSEGNVKFAASDFRGAAASYAAALRELDDDDQQQQQQRILAFLEHKDRTAAIKALAMIRANLAAALLNMHDDDPKTRAVEALRHAMRAVELDPEYAKGHARCASAFAVLGEEQAAKQSTDLAHALVERAKADRLAAANAARDARAAIVERRAKRRQVPVPEPPMQTTISVDATIDPIGLCIPAPKSAATTPLFTLS